LYPEDYTFIVVVTVVPLQNAGMAER